MSINILDSKQHLQAELKKSLVQVDYPALRLRKVNTVIPKA